SATRMPGLRPEAINARSCVRPSAPWAIGEAHEVLRSPCISLTGRVRAQESPFVELRERVPELLLRVHDDGTVPGHRLPERLAGDEQESDAVPARLDLHLVAAV